METGCSRQKVHGLLWIAHTLDLNAVCLRLSEGGEAGTVARHGQIYGAALPGQEEFEGWGET